MPGKPKIEERNWKYRQQQGNPDRQPNPKIQDQVNNHSQQGRHPVINGKNREQKVPWFPFKRVSALWTPVERQKPVCQGPHLVPGDKHGSFAAGRAFPAERIAHHPEKATDGIV